MTMSSSYGRIILCNTCGELVATFRVSGGATAVAAAESGSIDVESVVVDIATALHAGRVKVLEGECWVCVCAQQHSVEPFPEAVKGKD